MFMLTSFNMEKVYGLFNKVMWLVYIKSFWLKSVAVYVQSNVCEEHVAHSLALAKWQYLWAGKEESHALNFSISWKSL